jgi:hypothetical protein
VFLAVVLAMSACGGPGAWDRKGAHRHCKDAIAQRFWAPELTCAGMHVCINEAVLTKDEERILRQKIRETADCWEP